MSGMIARIAAEAAPEEHSNAALRTHEIEPSLQSRSAGRLKVPVCNLPVHQFPRENPRVSQRQGEVGHPRDVRNRSDVVPEMTSVELQSEEFLNREQERRTYRGRAVAMLRRYMRYSMETGRLPSLLGREFFRAKVTSYTIATFEDRVIFVHDMETCLERLDEFSQQLIARHILQEHDRWATARLLHCNEKTVRRLIPLVLDQLIEILLDVGLMERIEAKEKNCCQGGLEGQNFVSDCEEGK